MENQKIKKYFFNKTLQIFKEQNITNKKILLGVSGGLDSIVLLDILNELASPLQLQLTVMYIHHGKSENKQIQNYRDKARDFVSLLSQTYKIKFLSPDLPKKILKSEEDFRNFRRSHFEDFLKQEQGDAISLGHNQDDLLETRLIQLIRGCSFEGLKGMEFWKTPYLRPLLIFSRKEIKCQALYKNLKWIHDPSNKENEYLRNWIRNKWLPDLEKKRQGSITSLSRSLDSLCLSPNKEFYLAALTSKGLRRDLLIEMPLKDQKRVIASYMRKLKIPNYGQSHIIEILKHLDRKEKEFSLKLLKKTWLFTPSHIFVK